jgi:hypothetical protein
VCWRTAPLPFRCPEVFQFLRQFPLSREDSDFVVDAFLLNRRPSYVAPFIGSLVCVNGFRLSPTLESHVATVAELFLVMVDQEFSVLFNCCSRSQEFSLQFVAAAISLVADKEMPTAALISTLARMVEVNGLITDGGVRTENFMFIVWQITENLHLWNELEAVVVVDRMAAIVRQEAFDAHRDWAMVMFLDLTEMNEIKCKSFFAYIAAYLARAPVEELQGSFDEAWQALTRVEDPAAFAKAAKFLAMAAEERLEFRKMLLGRLPLDPQVLDRWPQELAMLRPYFVINQVPTT